MVLVWAQASLVGVLRGPGYGPCLPTVLYALALWGPTAIFCSACSEGKMSSFKKLVPAPGRSPRARKVPHSNCFWKRTLVPADSHCLCIHPSLQCAVEVTITHTCLSLGLGSTLGKKPCLWTSAPSTALLALAEVEGEREELLVLRALIFPKTGIKLLLAILFVGGGGTLGC